MKTLQLTYKGVWYVVKLDLADWERLKDRKWALTSNSRHKGFLQLYVRNRKYINGKRVVTYMHRAIVGAAPSEVVDHINGSGLDNRRQNLRRTTQQHNASAERQNRGRRLEQVYEQAEPPKEWL